jgi:hypothetical protein
MNWRETGDTTFAKWDALIPAHSEIKRRGESRACYDAAKPLSRLCLGMMMAESSIATHFSAVPASRNNPLNMKPFDLTYPSIADNIREWRKRITSPTYKNGVYKNTTTIADLIHVYAPSSDNNDEAAYVRTVEMVINRLPKEGSVPTPTTKPVFGKVPVPEIQLHDIVSTFQNTAFDRLGNRNIVGTCTHRMVGSLPGTDGYFAGGARALTDIGIGHPLDGAAYDGKIIQWIPKSQQIAPWANGPADDLEGDGVAFVQKFGVNAVNRDLKSVELSDHGNTNAPYGLIETPKHFKAHVAYIAYIFDQAEVPWDSFPVNPEYGIVTYLEHWEFGPKECPFPPVRNQTEFTQQHVRALLKMHQTGVGTTPTPVPPPGPVTPDKPYSASMDQGFLIERWGDIRRIYMNGQAAKDERGEVKTYRWNPGWAPCSIWLARAKEEKEFPRPLDWVSLRHPKPDMPVSMIPFENGWVLQRFDDKRGWVWAT